MKYDNLDVFVLTYNRANYLKIMLESLCTQTATGFNIKVLNNCSTDNTLEVIKQIKKEYPERNIEIITHKKNLGNFGNFKISQELASNEYTAIFHDDDAIHPEYIETAMEIFSENPDVVMCSGNLQSFWNVSNNDWGILYKDYYKYKKDDGVYYNFLINRPTFACNIYKTSAYKQVKYHPEDFGKLHDVVFMCEINKIGAVAFVLGVCIRWRQSPFSDSNTFKNGPYPEEIAKILCRLKNLNKQHLFLGQPLLWNFAYFLYKWAVLKNYETWKQFTKRLKQPKTLSYCTLRGGCFSAIETFFFSQKWCIDIFNYLITKRAIYYRKKIFKHYESRF